jgi:hypothetical protein
MRRWYGIIEGHIRQCEARGLATGTIDHKYRELVRFGNWSSTAFPYSRQPRHYHIASSIIFI